MVLRYIPSYWEINLFDGSKYKGSIINGKMHGFGTYTWPNGDQYIGDFAENRVSNGWFIHQAAVRFGATKTNRGYGS